MKIDQLERAARAWPILAKQANKKGQPFTYGELCLKLGLHHRAAGWFLGVIQRYCQTEGLPPLQALAVNKSTRLPGSGYVGSTRTHKAHQAALQKVYYPQKPWPITAPNFKSKLN
jgi:hypothetical protein